MPTPMLSLECSPLGKTTEYPCHYQPSLLFPIPRHSQRYEIGLQQQALPFRGVDIWTGFELSWLNAKGKPQIGIATFLIPADSPYLIESKSFKLYLNSYHQTRVESVSKLTNQLILDLSNAAGKTVGVSMALPHQFHQQSMSELAGEVIDDADIEINDYTLDPMRLVADAHHPVSETLCSYLLKSNCLVTGQPDWGSIMIRYTGPRLDREALLRYLVGFRQHHAFHEQCVERIFIELLQHCALQQLTVYARYTRRGGLDINPFRTNCDAPVPANIRTARQ